MPATPAALPFPSLPFPRAVDGRGRDPSPSPAVVGHKRGKPAGRSHQCGPAPAAPLRPFTDQRQGRVPGPRGAKAARAGVCLATTPRLARGPRRAGRVRGVGGVVDERGAAGSRTMRGGRLERHGRSASGESGIIATPANPAAEAVGWRAPRTKTNRRGGGGGDRPPALLQERPPLFWIRVEITPCFTARFMFCFCLRLGSNFCI
jgi:hypothetical protein